MNGILLGCSEHDRERDREKDILVAITIYFYSYISIGFQIVAFFIFFFNSCQ